MFLAAKAPWSFLLPFRAEKLASLILVGVATSTSTVLFQTITNNRILTPSIMGFDALYVLLLTAAVFTMGGFAVADVPPLQVFGVTSLAMCAAALALFGTLLFDRRQDLMRMVLAGVIFATLFRSLTAVLQRMIDPNEYAVIQVASYARFSDVDTDILAVAMVATLAALICVWRMRFRLDVIALGRDTSTALGETPRSAYVVTLTLIAVFVSVSTAFVGPVAFLGLIVVSIARIVTPSPHHAVLLPSAGLISTITLVGGQTVLERVLKLTTPLSVVVDVLGGAIFLILLLKALRK